MYLTPPPGMLLDSKVTPNSFLSLRNRASKCYLTPRRRETNLFGVWVKSYKNSITHLKNVKRFTIFLLSALIVAWNIFFSQLN